MSLTSIVKGEILKTALKKVATDHDTKTTVLGAIGAGVLATQIDWSKLFQGDPGQIGLLVGAVVAAVFGYYTNKANPTQEEKK